MTIGGARFKLSPRLLSIYHLSAKMISRKDGGSAIAAAAYRSGTILVDESSGITHDYSRKAGVVHIEIIAPQFAPEWVYDRHRLWNAVDRIERRRDAQLAREIEVALPAEITLHQQVKLVRNFVTFEFVAHGMIVDFAIHRDDIRNPHAHILLSTRIITTGGFGPKERSWSETDRILRWRQSWADVANTHLSKCAIEQRIDHRSLAAQGIDRLPGRKQGL